MSSSDLPTESLESVRTRLAQLTHSINILIQELSTADPLPPWSNITSHLNVLNTQLSSLSTSISIHTNALSSTNTFPLSKFPARAQENLLTTLLRKKLSPEVEEWVASGQDTGKDIPDPESHSLRGEENMNWALEKVIELQKQRDWEGEYTAEELKNHDQGWKGVSTGLIVDREGRAKRKGAANNTSTQVVGALRLEELFRFMNSGIRPN